MSEQYQSIDVGVDYIRLQELLAAGEWEEANMETLKVMLKIARREKKSELDSESIKTFKTFPCADLRTIDQLWVQYSNGHFGFSVQKRIWQEVGGGTDPATMRLLGDRLQWLYNEWKWQRYWFLTFSLDAREGHLPCSFVPVLLIRGFPFSCSADFWNNGEADRNTEIISSLMERLVKCNI